MAFKFMDWLVGRQPEAKQLSTMTPQQQEMQNMLLGGMQGPSSSGLDFLQQILGGDEGAFSDFEAPIKRQFEQEVIPSIAERFASMGTGGSGDSSAFQQTMGRSGRELSQNLAQMRGGLKMNALQQLQGLMNLGQQRSVENVYDPGSYGVLGGFLQGSGEGAGKAGMQYFLGG